MRLLSYSVGPNTPQYKDDPVPAFSPLSLMADSGEGNWHLLTLPNHCSTHVDVPWHYNDGGVRLTDLELSWWFYESPRLIDVPKRDDGLIMREDLTSHARHIADADFLLVRTGFGDLTRGSQPARWAWHSPGFDSSAAAFLRQFPGLRAVGMDLPSATAPEHHVEGVGFHRIAFGVDSDPGFFLIVEDMRIEGDLRQEELDTIVMLPVLLERLDGAPVTIVAR
jgi:kynurenine formamidase